MKTALTPKCLAKFCNIKFISAKMEVNNCKLGPQSNLLKVRKNLNLPNKIPTSSTSCTTMAYR